jgi:outer membrane protein W
MAMLRTIAVITGVGLVLLGGSALRAQVGVKLTASVPKGDLGDAHFLDNKVGYGVGVHLALPVPGGALVPRVDYTEYKNHDTGDAKAKMLQAGVDYDFYFMRMENAGPYLGVGAGYGSTRFQQDTPHFNDTPNNIFYAGQAGYMFTHHLGAEVRYTYAEYKPHFGGAPATYNSPTWNASLILQF